WWLRGVGLLGVLVFVALCRTEPSVLRAAAMGLVALAALGAGGVRKGLRALSVAILILLMIDPFLSRSVGFALSVLASGGIVWWARRWAVILQAWLPSVVADAVAVPLAAHLATLPVVAAISSRVSVVGLVTNAVAGPFVGPATVLGFAAAGLSLASSTAASVAGFGAAGAAQVILWVAHAGARFPGASWHWPANPWSLLVLGFASLVMGSVLPHLLARRWLSLVLALVLVVGFVRAPVQPGWPPRNWIFIACDVGQGDGLVVRAADRQAVVIDAGPDPASIRRCLDQLDVQQVPVLILTHFHADHVNGLAGVLDHRSVTEIWVSPLSSPIQEAAAVQALAQARGVAVRVPALGEEMQVGEAGWRVIGPLRIPTGYGSADGESSQENDASVVLLLTVRGVRILLTGDVEPDAQQAMLAAGTDLAADVLKIAHHGSGRQDPDFIAASRARVAIASAGVDNDYGHPAPRTVRLVRSLGMTLLRTDQDGSIAITSKNGELAAVTQHPRTLKR
ncbi:MAG: ComEC/Rec2 family competence protein, partial [Propionibacteriaceae bacterium]|nr:ComEC/Rec2 family competence protein [Propionibacteriaceae bacterium]